MDMTQDLITTLRDLDPWPFIAGFMTVLWMVEVKFGHRAKAKREQVMQAKLDGYDIATRQHREYMGIRAKAELEAEEFAE